MSITPEIDGDILQAAKELVRAKDKTTGQVISELARLALTQSTKPLDLNKLEIRDGKPVLPSRGSVVSTELVDRLIDESGECVRWPMFAPCSLFLTRPMFSMPRNGPL